MTSAQVTTSRLLLPAKEPLSAAVRALVVLVLFTSGLIDLSRSIPLGPVTSQAVLTMIYFGAGLFLLVLTPVRGTPVPWKTLPLVVFWLWAAASLAWTPDLRGGVQNVVVVGAMLVALLLSEATTANDPGFAFWLERQLFSSQLLAVFVYAASVAWFGPTTNDLFAARSFALFALLGVAQSLARWRYGARSGLAWAVAITFLIGVGQSRLALGIAIVLFPLAQLPTRNFSRAIKTVIVAVAVCAASYWGFLASEGLQQRFLSGDVSLKIGPITINGSGRTAFWRVTMQSFEESPIVGKGAGSAEALIESFFPESGHPHSDYLRVAHDYGIVGITLWAMGLSVVLVTLWRCWRQADRYGQNVARLQLTAMLSLVAFVLEMSMENAMVYVFVAAPFGLIAGSALGLRGVSSRHARVRPACTRRTDDLLVTHRSGRGFCVTGNSGDS
jgi:O-antigen ligase